MEKKLQSMFEYQKFSGNARLASLIEETEARMSQQMKDEDLFFVNAAGELDGGNKKPE